MGERHARVWYPYDLEAGIFHTDDDQPSLGIGHAAHALGEFALPLEKGDLMTQSFSVCV